MKRNIFFIIILSFFLSGCYQGMPLIEKKSFSCMNTQIDIIIKSSELSAIDSEKLFSEIKHMCREFQDKYSSFNPENLLSKINTQKQTQIDIETLDLLKKVKEVSFLTQGAYDFTIGSLLELWGFYSDDEIKEVPSSQKIQEKLSLVGYNKVLIDQDNQKVIKQHKDIKIDLAGVAKGYLVDKIVSFLKNKNINSALVNVGGDMYCLGKAPDEVSWMIGIQHPREKTDIIGKISIQDMAIATSGDYEKFYKKQETHYTHIIDPFTGFPVQDRPVGVTVIAPFTWLADGLATGIIVMGKDKGLKLINKLDNVEVIIVTLEKDILEISVSEGLRKGRYSFSGTY